MAVVEEEASVALAVEEAEAAPQEDGNTPIGVIKKGLPIGESLFIGFYGVILDLEYTNYFTGIIRKSCLVWLPSPLNL